MNDEAEFYQRLSKAIQAWLSVETATYAIYAAMMAGANRHLISVTFYQIISFEARLRLIDSCFILIFSKDSDTWKEWRTLRRKAANLNTKRNIIVHQPVHTGSDAGMPIIEISPSYMNSMALVKGQTTYKGPVISADYKPSMAKLRDEHKIDLIQLYELENEFENHSRDLRTFQERISSDLAAALESAKTTQTKDS